MLNSEKRLPKLEFLSACLSIWLTTFKRLDAKWCNTRWLNFATITYKLTSVMYLFRFWQVSAICTLLLLLSSWLWSSHSSYSKVIMAQKNFQMDAFQITCHKIISENLIFQLTLVCPYVGMPIRWSDHAWFATH